MSVQADFALEVSFLVASFSLSMQRSRGQHEDVRHTDVHWHDQIDDTKMSFFPLLLLQLLRSFREVPVQVIYLIKHLFARSLC